MTKGVRSVAGIGAGVATLVILGCAAWTMWPATSGAEDQAAPTLQPAVVQPVEAPLAPTATIAPSTETAPLSLALPPASPIDGLKLSSQSWRRGGLGSRALVTFTLRNTNEYAVKDIEIACAFARRDGSHLTDRKRLIADTVGMRSRRTFARVHVGFINVNADKAKCTLIAASRA